MQEKFLSEYICYPGLLSTKPGLNQKLRLRGDHTQQRNIHGMDSIQTLKYEELEVQPGNNYTYKIYRGKLYLTKVQNILREVTLVVQKRQILRYLH